MQHLLLVRHLVVALALLPRGRQQSSAGAAPSPDHVRDRRWRAGSPREDAITEQGHDQSPFLAPLLGLVRPLDPARDQSQDRLCHPTLGPGPGPGPTPSRPLDPCRAPGRPEGSNIVFVAYIRKVFHVTPCEVFAFL